MDDYPRFILPAFPGIPPARYRTDVREIEAAAIRWIRTAMCDVFESCAVMEHFIEQRTGLWDVLCYATARADRIIAICNVIDLLFALDSAAAKATLDANIDTALEQGCDAIGGNLTEAQSPWLRVLQASGYRFRADMPTPLWHRYVASMKGFLGGIVAERSLLRGGRLADFDHYDNIRKQTVGGPCLTLAEYGLGIDLTAERAIVPELVEIGVAVMKHWIAVNDIFSYRKELYAGDTTNKITLLIVTQSLTLQEAVNHVAQIARSEERIFQDKRNVILAGPLGNNPQVQQYIEALELMMGGNLEWSYITPRYHGRGHQWNKSMSGAVILAPSRTIFESAGLGGG